MFVLSKHCIEFPFALLTLAVHPPLFIPCCEMRQLLGGGRILPAILLQAGACSLLWPAACRGRQLQCVSSESRPLRAHCTFSLSSGLCHLHGKSMSWQGQWSEEGGRQQWTSRPPDFQYTAGYPSLALNSHKVQNLYLQELYRKFADPCPHPEYSSMLWWFAVWWWEYIWSAHLFLVRIREFPKCFIWNLLTGPIYCNSKSKRKKDSFILFETQKPSQTNYQKLFKVSIKSRLISGLEWITS